MNDVSEHQERQHPPTYYSVAIVLHNRSYGGPEEGGWWYDTYDPVDRYALLTKIIEKKEEAFKAKTELEKLIEEKQLNKGRRQIWSLASQGRYEAYIFYGSYPRYEPVEPPQYC